MEIELSNPRFERNLLAEHGAASRLALTLALTTND